MFPNLNKFEIDPNNILSGLIVLIAIVIFVVVIRKTKPNRRQ